MFSGLQPVERTLSTSLAFGTFYSPSDVRLRLLAAIHLLNLGERDAFHLSTVRTPATQMITTLTRMASAASEEMRPKWGGKRVTGVSPSCYIEKWSVAVPISTRIHVQLAFLCPLRAGHHTWTGKKYMSGAALEK